MLPPNLRDFVTVFTASWLVIILWKEKYEKIEDAKQQISKDYCTEPVGTFKIIETQSGFIFSVAGFGAGPKDALWKGEP